MAFMEVVVLLVGLSFRPFFIGLLVSSIRFIRDKLPIVKVGVDHFSRVGMRKGTLCDWRILVMSTEKGMLPVKCLALAVFNRVW